MQRHSTNIPDPIPDPNQTALALVFGLKAGSLTSFAL